MAGDARGSIMWSLSLPKNALWHKLVHGTVNSVKVTNRINGGIHTPEVLVVSPRSDNTNIEWICLEGTHGDIHNSGTIPNMASHIVRIVPPAGTGGACCQHTILIHEDQSLSIVPNNDEVTGASVKSLVCVSENGFFAHTVNSDKARLESLQIVSSGEDSSLSARLA